MHYDFTCSHPFTIQLHKHFHSNNNPCSSRNAYIQCHFDTDYTDHPADPHHQAAGSLPAALKPGHTNLPKEECPVHRCSGESNILRRDYIRDTEYSAPPSNIRWMNYKHIQWDTARNPRDLCTDPARRRTFPADNSHRRDHSLRPSRRPGRL